MPFDDEKWQGPARGGDVGSITIDLVVCLGAIRTAIEKISERARVDLTEELAEIQRAADSIFETFQEMTGWQANDES